MTKTKAFNQFISAVKEKTAHRISALYLLGSGEGINNPKESDIDLLAIVEDGCDKKQLYNEIRALETEYLTISHSWKTDYIQRNLFASDDFKGIHLMIMHKQQVKSKNLAINPVVDLFMSKAVFVTNVKREGKLLFGDGRIVFDYPISVGRKERILSFLPVIPLLLMPLLICNRENKTIWICKFARYHYQLARDYYRILNNEHSYSFDEMLILPESRLLITRLRYNPDKFKGNILVLNLKAILSIIKNWQFLFNKDYFYNKNNSINIDSSISASVQTQKLVYRQTKDGLF